MTNRDMEEIINKYGSFGGSFSRAMDFGGETPEMAIINLVVSDGDPSRGQRESLLSTEINRIEVDNGKHDTYSHCYAIITYKKKKNKYDKDDDGLLTEIKPENINKKENVKEDEGGRKEIKENNLSKKREEKEKREVKERKEIKEEKINMNKSEEKMQLPPGVASINKTEKIIIEDGDKKRVIKIIKIMEDGSKQIETVKEILEE